jgi:hypothetical protein
MKSMLADQMNNMFAEGGVMQEGGTVDPVSGNEVPPGSLQEEVRDDIPAKLSEGEFVIPADVVRYIGLEKLMMMRDKAKAGLRKMEEIGQMGNAEEVEDAEALHSGEDEMDDETFSSEIDSILGEDNEREFAKGGDVRKYAPGGFVGGEENKQLYADAPIKGFEMVAMTNDAGQTIYIPFINGVAQLSIPQGYKVKSPAVSATPTPSAPDTTPTAPTSGDGGDGGPSEGGGSSTSSSPGFSIGEEGFATPSETSPTLGSLAGLAVSMVTGIPGLSNIGKAAVEQSNFANTQAAMGFNVAVGDTTAAANNEGVTTAAATTGPSGTGGAAASAASAAAAAAAANGMSAAAQGAASQAAATATIGGATPSEASTAGANAAAAADQGDVAEGGSMAAEAGGGDSSGDGSAGASVSGEAGWAKGGFVSKKKTKTASKPTSLASRRK